MARPKPVYFKTEEEFSALRVSPQIARIEKLTQSHVVGLADKIAKAGQQNPVMVRSVNNVFELVTGRHRKAAVELINSDLKHYGLTNRVQLWGMSHRLSDEEAVQASLSENGTLPTTCIDLAQSAAQLDKMEYSGKVIGEMLTTSFRKVGASRVSQLLKLHVQPMEFKLLVHRGQLTEKDARNLMGLAAIGTCNNDEMVELAKGVADRSISMSELMSGATENRRNKLKKQGKSLPRSIVEIRNFLKEMGTDKSLMMLGFCDGSNEIEIGDVVDLFRDEG